ncbi:hypothetical protein EDB85DRAFT_2028835 [Lactarius pseudohatsudake]|nr:hypothetical protein EDB85DRAFT_2028835 [Lactarius pseudohatsudake]
MSPTTAISLATATPSSTPRSSSKNKVTIIIVAAVGGFLFIVALVLIIVPFARRRAQRRKNKQAESSSSSDVTSTTVNSRSREVHNRTVSADASVPLLEPDFSISDLEHSRFGTLTTQPDAYTQSSPPPTPSTVSSPLSPHLFAPTFRSFTAHPPLFDSEPRIPSRIWPMDPSPPRGPSPTSTSSGPHAPASPHISPPSSSRTSSPTPAPSPPLVPPSPASWLHVPKVAGIPLISAFRQSISSVASKGSSLPTMQHYPSFSHSQNAGTASTRSSQTFYSVGSGRPTDGHGAPPSPAPPLPPLPSEHGELPRPPVPRLKPGGGGERVPQVHLNISESHHPASRQASMEYAQNPAMSAKSRPVSSTVGSGSSLSMYVDARSQVGSAVEDGRWNGNGGVGGSSARGRVRS